MENIYQHLKNSYNLISMQIKKIVFWSLSIILLLLGVAFMFSDKLKIPEKTSNNVIKIYSSVPMRGLSSGIDVYNGAKLAFDEIGNKIGDFNIQFIPKDDGDDTGAWQTDLEKRNAEEAAADPDVMVYMGTYNSGAAKVSIPITNKVGLAQISSANTWPGLTQSGYLDGEPGIFYPTGRRTYFRTCATDAMQGPSGAMWAKELELKNIYIIDDNDVYGRGVATLFEKKAKELGLHIINHFSITKAYPLDIEKAVADIKKEKPDLVYYGGMTVGGIVPLIQGVRKSGVSVKFMGADGIMENVFLGELGKDAGDIFITSPGVPTNALPEKGKLIAKKYHDVFNSEPSNSSVAAYETAKIVIAAIEKAGVKNRAAILNELTNTSYAGIFGQINFDTNGDTLLPILSGNTVKNGSFEFVKILPN